MATQNDNSNADDTPPALVIDVPPCFAYKELSSRKCGDCGNARCCSEKCQKKDWPMHKYLCKELGSLGPRPDSWHYRGILFAHNHAKPKFVWVKSVKNKPQTEPFLDPFPTTSISVKRFHKFGRDVKQKMQIHVISDTWQGFTRGGCPGNKILAAMRRVDLPITGSGRTYLVDGILGYINNDLDTSALGPLLDDFR